MPLVLREDRDGVTTLTLNRPDKFNALSEDLLDALQSELDLLARETAVHVVILAGAGRAFCAGHDLSQMRAHEDKNYFSELFARCSRVMQTIRALPQPVIARVHGVATAAGCQLVATCDLVVASQEARFATSGINLGLFCSTPAVALSRSVPRKAALELLLTGGFVDAETAREIGLVNQVVTREALDATVEELAATIAEKSPVAVRTGKEMFYRQLSMPLCEAYAFAGEMMAENMMAHDAREGIDAFLEKRDPRWRGR
jgi:enoyl-CoA hydratase/carnithine racemase